jgi:hypothetical protein
MSVAATDIQLRKQIEDWLDEGIRLKAEGDRTHDDDLLLESLTAASAVLLRRGKRRQQSSSSQFTEHQVASLLRVYNAKNGLVGFDEEGE